MEIWLVNVPEHAVSFCKLMILFLLLDAIQGPLWMSVQATGKIRNYQLLMSLLILMNLPLSYLFLKMEYAPEIVLIVKVVVNLAIYILRIIYLNVLYSFPGIQYLKEVIARVLLVTLVVYPLTNAFYQQSEKDFSQVVLFILLSLILNITIITIIGLNRKERMVLCKQLDKYKHICIQRQ